MDENKASELLGAILQQASTLTGIKDGIRNEIKQDIKDLIFSRFKELSLQEVYQSFKFERQLVYDKKTDHFQLFSTEYVAEILKKYTEWKIEIKKLHNLSAPIIEERKITMEEKENNLKDFIKVLKSNLESYQKDKTLDDLAPILVNVLESINLIPIPTQEQYSEFRKKAINRAKSSIESRKDFLKIKEALNKDKDKAFKFQINQIRLEELFDRVIAQNKPLIQEAERRLRKSNV